MRIIKRIRNFGWIAIAILSVCLHGYGQRPELMVQTGYAVGTFALTFSPDGRLLASRTPFDNAIKIVEVATGRELRILGDDAGGMSRVAFSDSGELLAAGNGSNTVKVWEVQNGHLLKTLLIPSTVGKSPINAVAFSLGSNLLAASIMASSSEDLAIKIWDVATWREVRALGGEYPTTLAFTNDGKNLVGIGLDYKVKFWDVSTGALQSAVQLRDNPIEVQISGAQTGQANPVGYGLGAPIIRVAPNSELIVSAVDLEDKIRVWTVGVSEKPEILCCHGAGVSGLALSPDGKKLASGGGNLQSIERGKSDNSIKLWDWSTGRELHTMLGHQAAVKALAFSPNGHVLASGGVDDFIKLWDVDSGREVRTLATQINFSKNISFSSDGSRLIAGTRTLWNLSTGRGVRLTKRPSDPNESGVTSPDGRFLAVGNQTIQIWDAATNHILHDLGEAAAEIKAYPSAFSSDGRLLASIYRSTADPVKVSASMKPPTIDPKDPAATTKAIQEYGKRFSARLYPDIAKQVKIWDAMTGQELRTLTLQRSRIDSANLAGIVKFSPDGRSIAAASVFSTEFGIWDLSTGRQLHSMNSETVALHSIAFSGDGRFLASGGMQHLDAKTGELSMKTLIKVWDAGTGKEVRTLDSGGYLVNCIALSQDGQQLAAFTGDHSMKVWNVRTGEIVLTINISKLSDIVFSPNGRLLAAADTDGRIQILDSQTGEELLTLVSLNDGSDWLAVTPDGLFDGSPPAWRQIFWRFSDNLYDIAEVESFFNEFYRPDLLADVIAGKRPRAPRQIAQLDRRQPLLKLRLADQRPAENVLSRAVTIRLSVEHAPAGGRDVRLFRNGSLVKVWHGDVINGQNTITLEAVVPIAAGENRLTAYAFNRDNIKSEDATLTITGAESLKRASTVYVLAVGINRYVNPRYDLKFAVADAQVFGEEFRQQQIKLGRFAKVEVVPLFDKDATKENILLGLKRLAGSDNGPLPDGAPSVLHNLHSAQPEDAVVVYFAGHGTARQNQFFLVPHDLGYQGSRTQLDRAALDSILAHSISDRELEQAFEQIDAGQLLFIIDACNSGQALEAEEKRRGPMNAKGLAQLAYEKGMYILTAAQSYQAALETPQHGHGYLTYSLVSEGLKTLNADVDPRDGQVTVREWLDYATQRVPQLQEEDAKRPADNVQTTQGQTAQQKTQRTTRQQPGRQGSKRAQQQQVEKRRQLERDKPQSPAPATAENKYLQQPRVFYRREVELSPLVVARPN